MRLLRVVARELFGWFVLTLLWAREIIGWVILVLGLRMILARPQRPAAAEEAA